MNVTLVVFAPNGASKKIPLKPGRYVVGRHESATLRIPHPQVSRQHCEFTVGPDSITLRDLKSSNGTFRNQQRVDAAQLSAGDFVAIGPFTLGVQLDGQPPNLKLPEPEAPQPAGRAELAETPPAGAPAVGGHDTDDPDKTVTTKASPASIRAKTKLSPDDSSVFDFDFDFEDTDKPKKR